MANLPTLLRQTVGVLSTSSKADGWIKSGQYLSAVTKMAKVGTRSSIFYRRCPRSRASPT